MRFKLLYEQVVKEFVYYFLGGNLKTSSTSLMNMNSHRSFENLTTMSQDKVESLKIKLTAVTKQKLIEGRAECALSSTEHILSEELRATKAETELMLVQLEDLTKNISKFKCQIAMIEICEVSEKSKVEKHIEMLENHKNSFNELFSKEHEEVESRKIEIEKRKAEEEELKRQKQKTIDDNNLLQLKEAVTIEKECNDIEQECVVLKKRNKAIMLKLRRKLIESEELRREMVKNTESFAPRD